MAESGDLSICWMAVFLKNVVILYSCYLHLLRSDHSVMCQITSRSEQSHSNHSSAAFTPSLTRVFIVPGSISDTDHMLMSGGDGEDVSGVFSHFHEWKLSDI